MDGWAERRGLHRASSGRQHTSGRHMLHRRCVTVERRDWVPVSPPNRSELSRLLAAIQAGLRDIQADRVAACGHHPVSRGGVGVTVSGDGRARFQGLQHCGSVWACPKCGQTIKAGRAAELGEMMTKHGHDRAVMVSLTVRHGLGDDLKELRSGVGNMWRAFARGEPWQRFKRNLGIEGSVRALEVTHGPNGWHPHLHVLILLSEPLDLERLAIMAEDGHRPAWMDWISERWRAVVRRHMGERFEPSDAHGVKITPCHQAEYLSKLGLEISDPGHKRGRGENRSPLQIAHDYMTHRRPRDERLWRDYCEGMKGARQLTWSRGLRDRFNLGDRTDLELAQDEEPTPDDVTVMRVDYADWCLLRRCWAKTRRGMVPAPWLLLRVVETRGAERARAWLAAFLARRRTVPGSQGDPPHLRSGP